MKTLLALLLVASTAFATPRKVLLPGVVSTLSAGGYSNSIPALTLYCWEVVAPYDVANATKFAANITFANGVDKISFALYPDNDGAGKLASVTGTATAGAFSATGLSSYSVVGGTKYRVCSCATSQAAIAYTMVEQATTCCEDNANLTQFIQAFTPQNVGTAAHSCSGNAILPATTGAITPEPIPETVGVTFNVPRMPVVLIEQ